jgi:predicted MPP superfamily phosphohydrolase
MAYHILPDWAISTRALATTLAGLSLAGGVLISYASHIEPRWAEVVRVTLPLPRLHSSLNGLTVAQISDTHVASGYDVALLRQFVATANALHPDIAVITGDMFARTPRSARMSAEALAALRAPYGTFVVMGNHERHLPPEAGEMPFHRSGLTVLCNQA